uniref:Ig-like domain-containing protein n=1 Tax=Fundulus heteroclitus TaxID=8078 RepID=A0A3Q2PHK8_FUNHE
VNNVLELLCEATGIPTPTLTWLKDGRPLPQTDSLRLLRGGEVLRVTSAQVGLCRFKLNPFCQHIYSIQGKIKRAGTTEDVTYLAPLDSSVTLECPAVGSPPPSITWHKEGQLLSDSARQRVLGSGSLQIAFVQQSDAGRYTCTAANAAGADSLEMRLTVQSRLLTGAHDLTIKPTFHMWFWSHRFQTPACPSGTPSTVLAPFLPPHPLNSIGVTSQYLLDA